MTSRTHPDVDRGQNPYAEQLAEAGIPEELWPMLHRHGIGDLVAKMEIQFTDIGARRTTATMPVAGNTQISGLLHGGAHLVLAETLGSFSAAIHAGADGQALGIEIGATHHRGIESGTVTGTCTAIHLGQTLTTHEVVMTDEQGRRLSTARITNLIRRIRRA